MKWKDKWATYFKNSHRHQKFNVNGSTKVCPVSADTGHLMVMRNTIGTQHYPVVEVRVELDGLFCQEKTVVSEGLEDVLLGLDVNIWLHMVTVMNKKTC